MILKTPILNTYYQKWKNNETLTKEDLKHIKKLIQLFGKLNKKETK